MAKSDYTSLTFQIKGSVTLEHFEALHKTIIDECNSLGLDLEVLYNGAYLIDEGFNNG